MIEDKNQVKKCQEETDTHPKSEDWAALAQEEMEEFIESQGIYIRQ